MPLFKLITVIKAVIDLVFWAKDKIRGDEKCPADGSPEDADPSDPSDKAKRPRDGKALI